MSNQVEEQQTLLKELTKIVDIFVNSGGEIRPHFVLTGSSGSGKSHIVNQLAEQKDIAFLEINAAQLTKEGTAGNSLSKALSPLGQLQNQPVICFVDEFDKLFISGNSNSELAHETTNGVQNEFLKVLEADHTSVFGDYGKYINIAVENVLFVFAGAFNGQEDIDIDDLREFGVKTEFLGRVGLVFNTQKLSLESMVNILKESKTLDTYLKLFKNVNRTDVEDTLSKCIEENYEKNTLGIRMITTLIHQYFIKGSNFGKEKAKAVTFQKKLVMD